MTGKDGQPLPDDPEAARLVKTLDLAPHPEGGWFRETYRHAGAEGERGFMTAIYYLLAAGDVSHWHRVNDADEIWHFHAGAPLALALSPDGARVETVTLGPDVAGGARPQALVPRGCWQSAASRGAWSLVGCTVAPAFDFAGFEMAPPDWEPGEG